MANFPVSTDFFFCGDANDIYFELLFSKYMQQPFCVEDNSQLSHAINSAVGKIFAAASPRLWHPTTERWYFK